MVRPKNVRLITMIILLVILFALNYLFTGDLGFPTGDQAIWFHAGLLVLILGKFWIEHHFTKPDDVVINGLIIFVSISMLSSPPLIIWWQTIKYFSLFLVVAAFFLSWQASKGVPQKKGFTLRKFSYQLITRLGSATVLFSSVFVLSLISYFDFTDSSTKLVAIFWGIILIIHQADLAGLINYVINKKFIENPVLGRVTYFSEPKIVRFELHDNANCPIGSLVTFSESNIYDATAPIAVVTGFRKNPDLSEVEALIFDEDFNKAKIDSRNNIHLVDRENEITKERLQKNYLFSQIESVIGYAHRGTDISTLFFDLLKADSIEEGFLVRTLLPDQSSLMFQVVNGKLAEESNLLNQKRSFTVGQAEQLGVWDEEKQKFEGHPWVVPENSPIFGASTKTKVKNIKQKGIATLGHVPNSTLPVNISLYDLALFHSAILGVTGSGKSFLAFDLIEKCAKEGIKVICLDNTGDYRRYIKDAIRITPEYKISEFLVEKNSNISIYDFEDGPGHPIVKTNKVATRCLEWCKQNRQDEEVNDPKPKILIVLEEAHLLVPEWNLISKKDLKDQVNETSQVVLQARKYGLGFLIVTQRTANVTKSILNQCNTIFAFQAHDETGFDFMKYYMGQHHVRALPNLKKREGVLVGKASVSNRPIIVHFTEQKRKIIEVSKTETDKETEENITSEPPS